MATSTANQMPPTEELRPGPERLAPTLLVASDGRLTSHTLRAGQILVIGRGLDADIRIDEAWISRRHARLIVGPPLRLQDLGGANGIRLDGRQVARGATVPLTAGALVELGRTLLLVREPSAGAAPVASSAMATARALIDRIAATDLPILFLGETGAGKQVLAEAAHRASRRSAGPFVRVSAASLSDESFATELVRAPGSDAAGAAGGAPGLLEQAAGGTLFLDDVAELEPRTQARLLAALERAPRGAGAIEAGAIDVRIMAATNRSLRDDVAAGRFRADLLFRINGVSIHVPPLRERRGELRALADELLALACARAGRDVPRWTADALAAVMAHAWPGNVRELAHAIERAVAVHDGGVIDVADLGLEPATPNPVHAPAAPDPPDAPDTPDAAEAPATCLRDALGSLEEERIRQALARCGGNQSAAARMLGISRNTLIARIRAYGLPRPHGRNV